MATHAQNIANLRNAVYGEQVRGSMIELFDEDYDLCKNGVLIGTVISSASDPITGYPDGTLYINNSTWHLFKLEATAWSDKGSIEGPQGASVTGVVDNGDGTFYLTFSDGSHSGNIATIQGNTGPQGPQGPTGATGPAGRSVTSMTMSGTGRQHTIIATYSDGVQQTVGVVQDGADGTGTGDMSKATYDVNDVGYVDKAAALTDGTNVMPYSTVAGKADAATTLAGYGITDAYTSQEVDDGFVALPTGSAGQVPTSDGSNGVTWKENNVSNLTDTTITNVETNQALRYNGTKWVNMNTAEMWSYGPNSPTSMSKVQNNNGVKTVSFDNLPNARNIADDRALIPCYPDEVMKFSNITKTSDPNHSGKFVVTYTLSSNAVANTICGLIMI